MATYAELMAKARELAAAGRQDEAKRVAQIAVGMKAPESPPWGYVGEPGNYRPDVNGGGRLTAGARNAFQGMTFGFGDEIVAGATSLLPGRTYEAELERERERLRQNKEDYPGLSAVGEIGGAVATALLPVGAGARGAQIAGRAAQVAPRAAQTAAAARANLPLLTRMGGSAAAGAGMGGLYGFGAGEGGLGPRAESARDAAMLGGAFGAAVPAAVSAGRGLWTGGKNIATGAVEGVTGRGSQAKADRAILQLMERSGLSADDISAKTAQAAREGQADYRLMDALGMPGQRRASGVVRAGGDGANEIADFLRQRAIDAPDRMAGFVDDAMPTGAVSDMANTWTGAVGGRSIPKAATAEEAVAALKSGRKAVADVAYDAARSGAGPVDVRGAVAAIDDRIGGMQGVDIVGDGIDAKLARFRNRLISRNPDAARLGETAAVPSGVDAAKTSVELSDFNRVLGVKQDIEDAIGAAVRAGRGNEATELGKLKSAIDAALEEASSGYRFANDSFAKMSKPIGAVDEGATMARRPGRAEDTTRRFAAMSPEEQIAARAGYGNQVIGELQSASSAAPDVSRRFASRKRQAEIDAMALDAPLLRRRIDREGEMARTYQRALGGSRTADNLADIEDLSVASDALRAMRDVSVGNIPGAMSSAAGAVSSRVLPVLTGETAGTRKLIADALMSKNLERALAAAEQAGKSEAAKRALIAQILRGSIAPQVAQ